MDSLYVQKRTTETGDCFELCEIWPGSTGKDYPDGVVGNTNTLEEMHAMVENGGITCGVDWSRVEPKFLQKSKDWIKKNGQTETPEGCDFAAGDKVTYINEYGVIWPGHVVTGFVLTDETMMQYGRFIHIDTDAYWFPKAPGELVKESGRDIKPEFEWIYSSKPTTDGTHQHRNAVNAYVREFHAENPDPVKLADLKKQIKGV